MDIEYFLKNRTKFIRYFYEHAVLPFDEIVDAIENKKEPFIPPYSEDPEPPFLAEWIEAQTGIETVGHAALSMLAASLQLFLKEWVSRLERSHGMKFQVNKKKGWFKGYKQIFSELKLAMDECPANLEVVEQVVLARNRIQHPEQITSLKIHHSKKDLEKYPRPFFARDSELALDDEGALSWWLPPSVTSTKDRILKSVAQVELLCSWLESEYWKAINA